MGKLNIKKYQSKNKKNSGYGKTYGRVQYGKDDTLDTLDVAKHIQKHGSIFTQDVIVGVIQRFSLCIEELLQEGYKVKLDGLGTFYLPVRTEGEENEEDFNRSNIKRVRIQFLADKSKDYDWNTQTQTTRSAFRFADEAESTSGSSSGSSGSGGNDQTSPDQPDVERP